MPEQYPPLAVLPIRESTKKYMDQELVDKALQIVYEHRSYLFKRFAEREKQNLGLDECGDEFLKFVSEEVWKHLPRPDSIASAAASLILEARERSRVMYNLPPREPINLNAGLDLPYYKRKHRKKEGIKRHDETYTQTG